MKKVIRGRVYDTNTAELIGDACGGAELRTDFHYWEEELYKKKTGEYFLYCFGGGLSKYGVWHGNTGGIGEHIKPLSYDDAKNWAEKVLDGDKYVAEFGDPEENGDRTLLTFSITEGAVNLLKRAAQKRDMSASALIEELIREHLK